jgi:protein involved in polysaccharide export with SLBB domain
MKTAYLACLYMSTKVIAFFSGPTFAMRTAASTRTPFKTSGTLLGFITLCFSAFLFAGCASHGSKSGGFTPVPGPTSDSNFGPLGNPGAPAITNVNGEMVRNPLTPEMLRPSGIPFTLGPGDFIEIEIIGNATSRALAPVGLDGKIYYNLLPGLDVWGLTLDQTRALLEKELAKYVTQPQVGLTLRVVGSKHVWVLGRLNRPGIFPLTGSMTLLESLALAGGTAHSPSQITSQELADLRHSFVVRQGQFLPVNFYSLLHSGDMSQNIYLQPDDFVYVPSSLANEVYVLGAVRFPRAVPYQEPMSLISAIAGSDGPDQLQWIQASDNGPFMKDAYLSHVAIIRGSLAEPQIAVVDCKAIMKGHAPDVRLEPGDIIYVPNSPYTTIKRYVNLIVNTFVTTIAANEGIRAGGQNASVNVAVPVNVTTPPTTGTGTGGR